MGLACYPKMRPLLKILLVFVAFPTGVACLIVGQPTCVRVAGAGILAAFMLSGFISNLRSDVTQINGRVIRKSENPIGYWLNVLFFAVCTLVLIAAFFLAALAELPARNKQ